MQELYWVEDVDGIPHFCVFLKKVTHKITEPRFNVQYTELVTKSVKSDNVTYKNTFSNDSLARVHYLISKLPADAIPGAVSLYITTKQSLKQGA